MAEQIVGSAASGAATGFAVGGPIGAGIGAVLGGISGLFKSKAQKKEEKRRRMIAEYKAQVALADGEAQVNALRSVEDTLIKRNNQAYADDTMNVFFRGGDPLQGTDYLSIIDNVSERYLDVLNNVAKMDIARIESENIAEQIRMGAIAQTDASRTKAKAEGIESLLKAGQTLGKSQRFLDMIG